MEALIIPIVIVVIVGVVTLVIKKAEPSAAQKQAMRAKALATPLDPAVLAEVKADLARKRKIQAVKRVREATALGLAEALAMVEAIGAGQEPGTPAALQATPATVSAPATDRRPDLAERARTLRREGREVDAIRLVCDETGMGILDAQKFVRSLD